jgi:WD40 repeat protein
MSARISKQKQRTLPPTIEPTFRLGAIGLAISTAVVCPWPSQRQDVSSGLPRPSFVLHDKNLHPEKSHTILSPNGTFTISAGTSMIQVSSLSFSADGKLLAVGSTPGIVDVWNMQTKQKLRAFKGGTAVALSPDGQILEKDGNGIEIIDMASGKVKRTIPWSNGMGSEDHTIQSVSFNPSGTQILVASNGQDLKVFDVGNGALLATLTNTSRGTFSPDGSLVIGGDYRHLMTWNTTKWEVASDLPNGPDYVTAVAADPAKDVEVIGGPKSARLLELTTGAQLGLVGDAFTNFAAISDTDSLIFTYTSHGFGIWDATGGLRCLKPGNGYYTMAVSPDNHWLAAAPSDQLSDVAVWDLTELIAACSSDAAASDGQPK